MTTTAGSTVDRAAIDWRSTLARTRVLLLEMNEELIAKGITLPYLTNLLKAVYVQVAETRFKVEDEAPSVSRLSVLTGLQRRDIKRIQDAPPPSEKAPTVEASPEPRKP